jgi:hypothetical protein
MTTNKPDLVDQVMNELKQNNGNIESLNSDNNVVIDNISLNSSANVNDKQSNVTTNKIDDSTNIGNVERNIIEKTNIENIITDPQTPPIVLNPLQKPKKNIFNQIKNPIIVSMLYFIINKDIITNFIDNIIEPPSTINIIIKSIIIGTLFYITQLFTPDF